MRRYGEDVSISRPTGRGATTTHTERMLYVALTPTFAHDLLVEDGLNVLENDQSDFMAAGDADVQENDEITYSGAKYRVTTVAPSVCNGQAIVLHCLVLRVRSDT